MSKKIDINLDEIEALASEGYTVTMICDALNIHRSTAYKNSDIINTIKRGKTKARQKIIKDLMDRSKEDAGATASIFLAKQLKIFDDYFPTAKPKGIKDALSKISNIYEKVSKNELDSIKGDKLIHYLEVYLKGYEASEIEDRLQKIEELLQDEDNKK